ncbi:ribonuclease HII [Candidatus Peregrinibacteria bacterium]|jgi:ribonuclease HII|nr:ribonuclease HII [Candidatus Peregrinibacteria bacterium]MBT4056367.1 ribonuclease HII [Candidatus Peregrinibacteria bacterium]
MASDSQYIAGIDEAGRGPLAGPVVCAAVILKKGQKLPNLKDSKQLSHAQREKLFELITKNCISYGIGILDHEYIDKHNILKAVQKANEIAAKKLSPQPKLILIDGRDKQILKTPFKTIIKGDTFVRPIMAASILAKVTRDRLMVEYAVKYPEYRFEKHKGYGTRLHQQLLETHKPCAIHRKSYNPVANLLSK